MRPCATQNVHRRKRDNVSDTLDKEKVKSEQVIHLLVKIFLSFVLYSVIGYMYEMVLEVLYRPTAITDRGFLFGPYLPIYGTGAIIILVIFSKWRRKVTPVRIIGSFVGILLMTTVIELIGSYIMEAVTGGFMWDYSQLAFHYQGRIALEPSIRFAIGGTFLLYVVQPPFERSADKYPKVFRIAALLIAIIMLIDLLFSLM